MENVPDNHRFGLIVPDDDVTLFDLLCQSHHPESGLTDKIPNITLKKDDIIKEKTKPKYGAPSVRHRTTEFEKKFSDRQVHTFLSIHLSILMSSHTMMNYAPRTWSVQRPWEPSRPNSYPLSRDDYLVIDWLDTLNVCFTERNRLNLNWRIDLVRVKGEEVGLMRKCCLVLLIHFNRLISLNGI